MRRRALIPEAAAAGTLALEDLIILMSEEIQEYIIPEVLSLREEFSVADYDFDATPGTLSYPFPPRAVGPKLKEVLVLRDGKYLPLQRIEPEDETEIGSSSVPSCYYLKANAVIFPQDPGAVSLRFQYYLRPNALILTEDAGLITAIDAGTREVTVSAAPTDFTSSETYDFVQASPHFALWGMDLSATVAGNVLTFADALPDGLAVGDYVCLSGESPIPQIPVSLHSLLAQRTAGVALEALGGKVGTAEAMTAPALKRALTTLSPRVEQRPRYVINKHGPGFGRRGWR